MATFFRLISLSFLLSISVQSAQCQGKYSLRIDKTTLNIEGNTLDGYETTFTQSFKKVKKEWWRYIKTRGVLFNKITHLEIKIPPKGDATEPVYLVSKVIEPAEGNSTQLEIGLKDENIDDASSLLDDLRQLLLDFKVEFYTTPIQKDIHYWERESLKLGAKLNKYQSINKQPKGLSLAEIDSIKAKYSLDLAQAQLKLDSLHRTLKHIR